MTTHRSVGPSGRGRSLRTRALALATLALVVTTAMVLVAPAPAADARVTDPSPAVDLVAGPNTDISMTGTGDGLTISGFQPPTPIEQDPQAPYPATDPEGYESLSAFTGIILTASVDNPELTAEMYCINIRVSTQSGIGYESGTWDESSVPNLGYVTYILATYYPSTTLPDGLTDDQRATAVQAAVWYFTDGYVVSSTEDVVRSAAAAIVTDAQSNGPAVQPAAPDVTITPPTIAAPIGSAAGPFVVQAQDDAALTVSVPDGSSLYTDAAGTVPLVNPSTIASGTSLWVRGPPGSASSTVVSARAVVTVPSGQVYLYDGNNPDFTDAQRLILAATAELEATAQATATFFVAGSLTVTKSFAGEAAGRQGASQLLIDCGPGYVFPVDIPAETSTTQTFSFENIPVNTSCEISEPVPGTNAVATVTSDAPITVTVTAAGTAANITNTVTFQPGGLTVTKAIAGPTAGLQGEIVLDIDCGEAMTDTFVIPANQPAGTYTRTYTDLPAGTECTITETDTGASSEIAVAPGPPVTLTIEPGVTAEASIINTVTYQPGGLNVTKTIVGSGAGRQGAIVLDIDCGDALIDTFEIPANQPAGNYTRSYADLPAGTECTVSESTTGDTESVDVVPGLAVTVAIAPGTITDTVLTNTVTAVDTASGSSGGGSTDRLPFTGAGPTIPLLLAGGGVAAGLLLLALSTLIARRRPRG